MYRLLLPWFALIACTVSLPAAVCGQETTKPAGDVLMSYPILFFGNQVSPIRIVGIDRDSRQARLTFATRQNIYSPISQGDSILLLQNEQTRKFTHAVRVKVVEQLEKGEALFEFGPEAAKILKECPVLMVTPFEGLFEMSKAGQYPVSTRRLKELPEIMAISESKSDSDANAEDAAKMAALRVRSVNNLKQIMLAMHNFHSAHGHFPPAVIYGPNGKPWHSWRVLILPFLEQNELYGKYDFSKPWDAPENVAVRNTVVEVYKDPVYGNPGEAVTHYAVLVGEQALFKPSGAKITDPKNPLANMKSGARGVADIIDGTAFTLAVVPVADDRKIPWTKPEDIAFGPGFPGLGQPGGIAAPYSAPSGKGRVIPMAFADGSVIQFLDTMDMDTLRAMITFRGSEVIGNRDDHVLREARPNAQFPILKFLRKPGGTIEASIGQSTNPAR